METDLFAAEAGMPQLDPTYWASQAFWLVLVFSVLYISIAKFYLPKIKKNLDDRENKIKEDLDEANSRQDKKMIKHEKLPGIYQVKVWICQLVRKRAWPPDAKRLGPKADYVQRTVPGDDGSEKESGTWLEEEIADRTFGSWLRLQRGSDAV